MSYERDRRLASLFSLSKFSVATPLDSEILRQAETEHLGHEPKDEEWNRLEPEVRKRWTGQQEKQVSEAHQRLKDFLTELPGPRWESSLAWDARHQRILDDWLRVPRICVYALREFSGVVDFLIGDTEWRLVNGKPRLVKKKTFLSVSPSEISKYRGVSYERARRRDPASERTRTPGAPADLPALTARWVLDDAQRAWKNRMVQEAVQRFPGASVRFILLLSFVPTAVFLTLGVRRAVEASRRTFADVIRRYSNPATKLSDDDPYAYDLLQARAAGEPRLAKATDEDLKRMICHSCQQLRRESERAIWSAIGLDKTPKTGLSRHEIWDTVASPLLSYLKPFSPRRKDDPSVIPDSLFSGASRLLHTRYPGFWEDAPGRLKSRYWAKL